MCRREPPAAGSFPKAARLFATCLPAGGNSGPQRLSAAISRPMEPAGGPAGGESVGAAVATRPAEPAPPLAALSAPATSPGQPSSRLPTSPMPPAAAQRPASRAVTGIAPRVAPAGLPSAPRTKDAGLGAPAAMPRTPARPSLETPPPAAPPAAAPAQLGAPGMPLPARTAAPGTAPTALPPKAVSSAAAPRAAVAGAAVAAAPLLQQQLPQLDLPALRQLFFDQPTEPFALRARLVELQGLRRTRHFPDGGRLWDQQLARLLRYLQLLEQQQAEGATLAAEGMTTRCDLCAKQVDASQLRRMQVGTGSPPARSAGGFAEGGAVSADVHGGSTKVAPRGPQGHRWPPPPLTLLLPCRRSAWIAPGTPPCAAPARWPSRVSWCP